jgi:hypothetical protein
MIARSVGLAGRTGLPTAKEAAEKVEIIGFGIDGHVYEM